MLGAGFYPTSLVHVMWGSRGQEDGPFHICVECSRPLFPSGRGRGRISHLIARIALLGGSVARSRGECLWQPVRNRRETVPVRIAGVCIRSTRSYVTFELKFKRGYDPAKLYSLFADVSCTIGHFSDVCVPGVLVLCGQCTSHHSSDDSLPELLSPAFSRAEVELAPLRTEVG